MKSRYTKAYRDAVYEETVILKGPVPKIVTPQMLKDQRRYNPFPRRFAKAEDFPTKENPHGNPVQMFEWVPDDAPDIA